MLDGVPLRNARGLRRERLGLLVEDVECENVSAPSGGGRASVLLPSCVAMRPPPMRGEAFPTARRVQGMHLVPQPSVRSLSGERRLQRLCAPLRTHRAPTRGLSVARCRGRGGRYGKDGRCEGPHGRWYRVNPAHVKK